MYRGVIWAVIALMTVIPSESQACLMLLPSTTYGGNSIDSFQGVRSQATPPGEPDPTEAQFTFPTSVPSGPTSISAEIGSSYAHETFQYYITGADAIFTWSVDLYEDGSEGAFAYQTYRLILSAEEDAPFSFSTDFPDPVLSQPGVDYRQQLIDITDQNHAFIVFSDNDPTYQSGILQAGHVYILYGYEQASPGSLTSASGTFTFLVTDSVCSVPEPGGLTLAGMGAFGLVAGAIRRRRQTKAAV